MPEWIATSPWWAFLTVGGLILSAGIWIGKVHTNLGTLKSFTENVRDDIRELRQDIKRLLSWQGSPTVGGKSPLSLTEIGKKVSNELNMPDMAARLAPYLKSRVEGMLPYDIQEFCFDYIRDEYQLPTEYEAQIKQCAYDNGLDCDDILDALAIVLRDKLLEENQT